MKKLSDLVTKKVLQEELEKVFKESNKDVIRLIDAKIHNALRENNDILMGQVDSKIQNALRENNDVLINRIGDKIEGMQVLQDDKIKRLETAVFSN